MPPTKELAAPSKASAKPLRPAASGNRRIPRRIMAALAACLLTLAFSACDAGQEMEQPQEGSAGNIGTDAEASPGESPEGTAASPEPGSPVVLREPFFDFDALAGLPEPPESYRPELAAIPMTDHYIYYGASDNRVYGPVAFIDSNLDQVPLPEGERDWYYSVLEEVGDDGARAVYGYVIYIDGRRVYVDAGGSVFPDFYPEQIWGADMAHYLLQNGYLITAAGFETDNPEDAERPFYRQLCGVMDLRAARDVIPPQYDSVILDAAAIWAIRGGEEFLFDYEGNLLAHSSERAGSYEGEGVDSAPELDTYERQYRTLYLPAVYRHGGMVVAHAKNQGVSVFTDGGEHLLSVAEEDLFKEYPQAPWRFFKDEGKVIFRLDEGSLLVVYSDGRHRQLRLPRDIEYKRFYSLSFDGGMLAAVGEDKHYVRYNDNGMAAEYVHEPGGPYVPDKYDAALGGRPLLGADGDILLPGGAYIYYKIGGHPYTPFNYGTLEGPFIMAYKAGMAEDGNRTSAGQQVDILDMTGKILLRDVLGANCRGPSFPGTMVVWLDETHSVLLGQDGSARPIPQYTRLEWHN